MGENPTQGGGEDTDLGDFDAGVTHDPPRIQKRHKVTTSTPDGTKTAGYTGPCPERGARAYITVRDSERHRFYALESDNGGAYAISIDALRGMSTLDNVKYVFVHETDTNTLYEWRVADFRKSPTDWRRVPDTFLEHADDPQAYVAVDSARREWEVENRDFYIPRAENVEGFE